MTTRRGLLALGGTAALLPAAATAAQPVANYEWAFLKSLDADPARLVRFIETNWFAMDKRAVAAGLMSSYALYVAVGDGDWNLVVAVGYPKPGGYAAIAAAFEAIRATHVTVPVDGRTLRELGRITGTRSLRPIIERLTA